MDILRQIHANFWPLMAICVAVFVAGLLLYVIGKIIQGMGEQKMDQCRYGLEMENLELENERLLHEQILRDLDERQGAPLYPPVEDYDPLPY